MQQDREGLRAESLVILDVLKDRSRAPEQRVVAMELLLSSQFGFWRRQNAITDESLRGFLTRVARSAIEAYRLPPFIDGEDIAQDALAVLFHRAWRIRTNPTAWLRKIVKNLVLIRLRREYGVKFVPVVDDLDASVEDGKHAATSPRLRLMRKAINRLPEKTRSIVKAHLRGLTSKEIAIETNMSDVAVRKQLSRARVVLKTYVESRIPHTPAA